MHKDARECLKRATECARLAESVEHPELKLYLAKLAASWSKVATEIAAHMIPPSVEGMTPIRDAARLESSLIGNTDEGGHAPGCHDPFMKLSQHLMQ